MCILSYLPPGVPVAEEDLLNGGLLNSDGHGWAIADEGKIIMDKDMDLVKALDGFIDARERHPEGHALFHSRFATHGRIDTSNVHPFLVGGSHKTVMAHNGILPCTPKKTDVRSDTRLFADEILSTRYRRLDKQRAFDAMERYIGKYNKLVILTVDPRYRKNAYIVNESSGNWDKSSGIWHSNYDYLGYPRQWVYRPGPSKSVGITPLHQLDDEDNCLLCGYGVIGKGGFCTECGSCEDCMETKADCQCWLRYGDWAKYETPQLPVGKSAMESAEAFADADEANHILGYAPEEMAS